MATHSKCAMEITLKAVYATFTFLFKYNSLNPRIDAYMCSFHCFQWIKQTLNLCYTTDLGRAFTDLCVYI